MSLWETHMGISPGFGRGVMPTGSNWPRGTTAFGAVTIDHLPVRAETRQDPLPGGHCFLSLVTERPSLLSHRTDETHAAPRVPRWFRLPL